MHIHTCIHMAPAGSHSLSKCQGSYMALLLLSCWSGRLMKVPKQYRLFAFLLLAHHNQKIRPHC